MDPTTTDWITAIATAFAAVGTVGALVFAAKAATAAGRSAAAANRAVAAASRPLLLDVPYENYTDYEHEYPWPGDGMRKSPMRGQILIDATCGKFVLPIRNVGRGAARIESVSLSLPDADVTCTEHSGIAVPVGEDAWLPGDPAADQSFTDALGVVPSPAHGPMPYQFTVTYTDIAGEQKQRLQLGVGTRDQDNVLRVLQIGHVALDEQQRP